MAITMRRGLLGYFDRKKLKPGELAITTDGGKLYYCYAAGKVKEVAAVEDLQNILDAQPEAYEALKELVSELEDNTASVSSILSQLGALRTDVNGKVAKTDIVNNNTTADATKVVAAPVAKDLKERIDVLNDNLECINDRDSHNPDNTGYQTLLEYVKACLYGKKYSRLMFSANTFPDLPTPDWGYSIEATISTGNIEIKATREITKEIYIRSINANGVWQYDWERLSLMSDLEALSVGEIEPVVKYYNNNPDPDTITDYFALLQNSKLPTSGFYYINTICYVNRDNNRLQIAWPYNVITTKPHYRLRYTDGTWSAWQQIITNADLVSTPVTITETNSDIVSIYGGVRARKNATMVLGTITIKFNSTCLKNSLIKIGTITPKPLTTINSTMEIDNGNTIVVAICKLQIQADGGIYIVSPEDITEGRYGSGCIAYFYA